MSQVKISPYPNSYGWKLELDGQEVKELRDFSLDFSVESVATLRAEMFIEHPFEFEAADIRFEPTFLVLDDRFQVVREEKPDGRVVYRVQLKDEVMIETKNATTYCYSCGQQELLVSSDTFDTETGTRRFAAVCQNVHACKRACRDAGGHRFESWWQQLMDEGHCVRCGHDVYYGFV